LTLNNLYSSSYNYFVDQIKKNEMNGLSNTNFSRKAQGGGGGEKETLRLMLIEKKCYKRS